MFWIIGGEGIVHSLKEATGWGWATWMSMQLEHVEWNGFHFYDLIFPLFLFFSGVTMPFSLTRKLEMGIPKSRIYRHVILRGLILVLLGCIYNGLLQFDFANQRYASVLAQIGIAWMLAAFIFLNTGWKGQLGWGHSPDGGSKEKTSVNIVKSLIWPLLACFFSC